MPETILYAILYLAGCGVICYILWWGLGQIRPVVGEPWGGILLVLLVLVIVFVAVNFVMAVLGQPLWGPPIGHWKR